MSISTIRASAHDGWAAAVPRAWRQRAVAGPCRAASCARSTRVWRRRRRSMRRGGEAGLLAADHACRSISTTSAPTSFPTCSPSIGRRLPSCRASGSSGCTAPGLLGAAILAAASLGNVQRLIELKNAKASRGVTRVRPITAARVREIDAATGARSTPTRWSLAGEPVVVRGLVPRLAAGRRRARRRAGGGRLSPVASTTAGPAVGYTGAGGSSAAAISTTTA